MFYAAYIEEWYGEKFLAGVLRIKENENLVAKLAEPVGYLKDQRKIVAANLCKTKKAAYELAEAWNESFDKNGTAVY